jgi:hypothetical protein
LVLEGLPDGLVVELAQLGHLDDFPDLETLDDALPLQGLVDDVQRPLLQRIELLVLQYLVVHFVKALGVLDAAHPLKEKVDMLQSQGFPNVARLLPISPGRLQFCMGVND